MKITRITNVSYTSKHLDPYLYTTNPQQMHTNKDYRKLYKSDYLGGFLALCATAFALSKFKARITTPKSAVEIADKAIGFNKLKGSKRAIHQIKEAIFYPMMCLKNGEKRILKGDFKTGLIIGNREEEKIKNFIDAFIEHAKKIDIHCVELKAPQKANRTKEAHKAIDEAIEFNKRTGECVIVNLGDLSLISNHNVAKTNFASNLEERLAKMPKGILWTAYTTKVNKLPYFYNNLPTLSVKI